MPYPCFHENTFDVFGIFNLFPEKFSIFRLGIHIEVVNTFLNLILNADGHGNLLCFIAATQCKKSECFVCNLFVKGALDSSKHSKYIWLNDLLFVARPLVYGCRAYTLSPSCFAFFSPVVLRLSFDQYFIYPVVVVVKSISQPLWCKFVWISILIFNKTIGNAEFQSS